MNLLVFLCCARVDILSDTIQHEDNGSRDG